VPIFFDPGCSTAILARVPTGIVPVDPTDAIFNPGSADKIPTAFEFRWNLKDTDTE
jgi:hypothetical protein